MVIVDTSVWSLAFRRKRTEPSPAPSTAELARLIEHGEALIAGPIRQELLSGVTSQTQFKLLRERLEPFPDLPIIATDYERAAMCFNQCRARGIQGSNTDYLICAVALRLQLPVFSADKDFVRYAGILGVRLHALVTGYTATMSMYNLLATLSGAEVDYVLIGGLAVTLHGYQRVTMDVDVVLAMNDTNLAKFIDSAKQAGLKPVLPISIDALRDAALIDQWHREKGMLAFALRGPDMMATVIDVLVRPVVSFEELRRNAVVKRIGTLSIPVADIDDLIRLKTGTGRTKDVLDIEELGKIKQQLTGG